MYKQNRWRLYQLTRDGFNRVRTEVNQRLDGMDTRLCTVENSISEPTGKQSAIAGMRNWITIVCATGAVIISIAIAIFK